MNAKWFVQSSASAGWTRVRVNRKRHDDECAGVFLH